jgi:hypothetical protein
MKRIKRLTKQERADFLFNTAFVIPVAFIGLILGIIKSLFKR